jgi:hypothetical protein
MFSCEICNYNANTKAVLARHLTSKKHIKQTEISTTTPTPTTIEPVTETNPLECKNCNKEFKFKGGLERHMTKCKKVEEVVVNDSTEDNEEKDVDSIKKEYEHNITRLIVEIIRNRYEFEIETELLKKSYEEKISEMKNEFERLFISKELENKKLQVQIQMLTKKK